MKNLQVGVVSVEVSSESVVKVKVESGSVSALTKKGIKSIFSDRGVNAKETRTWLNQSFGCNGFSFRVNEQGPAKKTPNQFFKVEVRRVA